MAREIRLKVSAISLFCGVNYPGIDATLAGSRCGVHEKRIPLMAKQEKASHPSHGEGPSRHKRTKQHGWSPDVDEARQQENPSAHGSFHPGQYAPESGPRKETAQEEMDGVTGDTVMSFSRRGEKRGGRSKEKGMHDEGRRGRSQRPSGSRDAEASSPECAPQTAVRAAPAVPGVQELQPSLRHSLADAATHLRRTFGSRTPPPEAGIRAGHTLETDTWHLEVRCVVNGHPPRVRHRTRRPRKRPSGRSAHS
ncbi:hypothetical protein [Streptomyces tubercidicus]|uniref:hypothetical protein n=1 Tax=Streptomyces tubercidicus TaxID=47759 RepID=UPI002E192FDC